MGLTAYSSGVFALSDKKYIKKREKNEKIIALAGNPNVGKSTVFNALTGLHQHTGNWAGKTVSAARGSFFTERFKYTLVDIPGTYSLLARSAEEEAARNFLCFGGADAAVVVCDASCLERSLNLALQIIELCPKTIVCVNLLDEAERAGIKIDLTLLEKRLGVPVAGIVAQKKKTLKNLTEALDKLCAGEISPSPLVINYPEEIEKALFSLSKPLEKYLKNGVLARWTALEVLGGDALLLTEIKKSFGAETFENEEFLSAKEEVKNSLEISGITRENIPDMIVSAIFAKAEEITRGAVSSPPKKLSKADKILTSRAFGIPIMMIGLAAVFWLTIIGANYPSERLGALFSFLGEELSKLFDLLGAPEWLRGIVVDGAYRVLAWVVSVMLPPMAIFFPLFTLLEDLGYLPRVAYNLDRPFCKCKACGKQSLSMCMGFGCNAAGIVGCRIIDSRRERLIAMLTNNFVPCNGRFPMIITLISAFFLGGAAGFRESLLSAAALTAVILLGVAMTFLMSRLLSATILKGEPSSFTLELPPFRKPQVGKILLRSLLDRTVFVLGRAAAVAAPAGAVIWILANVTLGDKTLLLHITDLLDPFGKFFGMDGVIIAAFLLGLPANETVIPIIAMTYAEQGRLSEISPAQMGELFSQNGWTPATAVCVILFTLMHFPCSTSLLTIKKEAGGVKWALLAFALPTVCGLFCCFIVKIFSSIFALS